MKSETNLKGEIIMKRILSMLLVLVLLCGLFPTALAASAPVTSSNLDNH